MRHTFLFVTVKIWLKSSVYIYGSYRKIKTGFSLFWTTLYLCVQYIPPPTWSNHTEVVRLQALSVKFVMQSIFSKNSVGCQWTAELTTRSLFFATMQLPSYLATTLIWFRKSREQRPSTFELLSRQTVLIDEH